MSDIADELQGQVEPEEDEEDNEDEVCEEDEEIDFYANPER